jgi:hypothetical protein
MTFATQNASTADEARRNRNRENAKRSTGAKTPFGRAASFANLNRTTHGLTADFHLLPDEPEELVQQRLDAWSEDLKPETEPERYQVLLVVRASIKLDRADAAEAAAATKQMIAAAETNDEQRAAHAARLGAVLTTNPPEDPTALVEQLRKTTQGCQWMIAQWDELIAKLKQVPGRTFEPNERRLGLYLLGKDPTQVFTDGVTTAWDTAHLGVHLNHLRTDLERVFKVLAHDKPPVMPDSTFERQVKALIPTIPDRAEGMARMLAMASAAVAELTDRVGLLEAKAELDRRIAIDKARFDESKDAALRLRYTTANKRMMDGAVATLNALKAQRLAEAKAAAEARARAEATAPRSEAEPAPGPVAEPSITPTAEAVPTGPAKPARESHAPSPEPVSPGPILAECSAQTPRDNRSP